MKYLERLSRKASCLTRDIAKDCYVKYQERIYLHLYVSNLTGDIVKDCHMKYLERLSLYIPYLTDNIVKDAK